MIWVLTAEPYHENSIVLGAFDDLKPAVDAFLTAAREGRGDEYHDAPELWELTSWADGVRRRTLTIYGPDVMGTREVAGKAVLPHPYVPGVPRRYEVVDPLTFEW